MKRTLTAAIAATTALTALAPSFAQAEDVTLTYAMWDANQAPVYRQCADKFEAANPGIKIKVQQDSWDNYWTSLSTAFVAGNAPDVFVNHLSRFPEFLANGVMVDLAERIAADQVDMKAYLPGLAKSWSKDGQWGLPKDWDTIALVYDKKKLADAGVTEEEMKNLDWNPKDGGSLEKVIARLTVDQNGKHGNEPGFDKSKVAVYGWATDRTDGYGQTQWSFLAVSDGFKPIDKAWGTQYGYDSPALAETLTWQRDLALKKGFALSQDQTGKLNATAIFAAGKAAIVPDGSWNIGSYRDTSKMDIGFAPVPKGPEGRRSMFNGLADSIWSGSQHQDEAWKWVKYLGGSECQTIVGNAGVVFPARPEGVAAAEAAHKAKNLDVSAFIELAKPETTFPFPISDHASEISAILNTAVENVLLDKGDPATLLKDANDQVNGMF